jgi:3-oxoacyl-[acyl-carrier protein] reductase
MTATSTKGCAIVTGAAGGIGRAIVKEFAALGHAVVLVDSNAAGLEEVSAHVAAMGGTTLPVVCDLTDLTAVEAAVKRAVVHFGRIEVLVNNAATRRLVSMKTITPPEWDATLRLCLTAPAFLSRWTAEEMLTTGGGVIVNIGSMMARQAHGLSPDYVACKAAIEALTYDLAALYGRDGIRVVTVAPGAVDTDFVNLGNGTDRDSVRVFSESMTMLGRWAQPSEVAKAVAWVSSPEASYLTGTTLVLDGGWSRMHLPADITRPIAKGR